MQSEAQKRATAKYNAKVYTIVKAYVPKELAEKFKAEVKRRGDSQAQIIREAIEKYLSV